MSQIIPYLAPGALTNTQSDVTDLQSLSGMPDNSVNHGTFTGSTIPDNQTTKQALQALETEVENRESDIVQSRVGAGPGYYFDGVNDQVTVASFQSHEKASLVIYLDVQDTTTHQRVVHHSGGTNDRLYVAIQNGNYIITQGDGTLFTGPAATVGRHCLVITRGTNEKIYLDGKLTHTATSTFGTAGSATLYIGRSSTATLPFKGHIYGVRYFNRELSASEVALVSLGQYIGLSDYGADGSPSYESNPSGGGGWGVDTNGWLVTNCSILAPVNSIGGRDDVLRATIDATNSVHQVYRGGIFTVGKRWRVQVDFYIPSSNSNVDGIEITSGNGTTLYNAQSPSLDTWHSVSVEAVSNSDGIIVYATDGGNTTVHDTGGDDVFYLKNVIVTRIGCVLDLNPDGAAPAIWADASGNGYNGTVTGATLINPMPLHADGFVSFTNLPTSSAGLATGRVWNDSGTLKIV